MKRTSAIILLYLLPAVGFCQSITTSNKAESAFDLAQPVSICTDEADPALIQKAAALLARDIEMVTGRTPNLIHQPANAKNIILVGTIEQSSLIQRLITQKKLDTNHVGNRWEAYKIQLISKPFAGVENALVIVGSDRRGAAFGVFDLSQQIGVSPWYWWADVPVQKKTGLYIKKAAFKNDAPAVKYRGIFINDEAPALSGWSKEKFGGFNHLLYEKVFELILRLKGNYLWPAMWGNAFYDDDSLNIQSADEYGIVIGTSHHEPLMRAHDEWRRYGSGKWNYDSNEVKLKEFWEGGLKRATNEKIVSIGMRGDGDEPMTRETATALLERIVKDQRAIIEKVTGKPASSTPQLWALYKEVQDYYDKGMRVPDDVTLLLCDDNWGNIRKLPKPGEAPRSGGYGIYYHFDYVGGPRNYKWINTNNLARVWEQMHLAWEYNARQIWIVNVGDIKPMELPISFFLDYAWNPSKWNEDNLRSYYTHWATQQFGATHAKTIGNIARKYAQYSARRKPELIDANTYSIDHYDEAHNVLEDYGQLLSEAEKIGKLLPAKYKDAYFQLILHPVKAYVNQTELYIAVALNRKYAAQDDSTANQWAEKAKQLYFKDSLLTIQYNQQTANGKWNHMMDQTHIGYTYWQQPPVNSMPAVKYIAPGKTTVPIKVIGTGKTREPRHFYFLSVPKNKGKREFYETAEIVSIEAEHYTQAVNTNNIRWKVIPDIGKTGSGITSFPVTAPKQQPGGNSPHLQYITYLYDAGAIKIQCSFSPTLNFHNDEGLQYGISIDDEAPQIISINKDDNVVRTWTEWVANNVIKKTSEHTIAKPGKHVIKYWMVTPGVVLQKIVMDAGGLKESYLGPGETIVK